jgi:hypothetical protein
MYALSVDFLFYKHFGIYLRADLFNRGWRMSNEIRSIALLGIVVIVGLIFWDTAKSSSQISYSLTDVSTTSPTYLSSHPVA